MIVSDTLPPTGHNLLIGREIDLARHALGLPNERCQSYRNRFVAGPGHRDYDDWTRMVGRGAALVTPGYRLDFGGADLFELTLLGARAALMSRETLDAEDFV